MEEGVGVKARISKKGIDYANSVLHDVLTKELQTLEVPDLDGDGHRYNWNVRSIENQGCTLPNSSLAFVPDQNALHWSLSGLGIKLKGHWKAKYRQGWLKASDGGTVTVEIQGALIQVLIKLGVDGNGRPSVTLASCDINVNNVHVEFHGGAAFVYNLFSDVCGKKLKKSLADQVHKAMEKFINEDGAKTMSKLKVSVPFAKHFTLDYGLVRAPSVLATCLETHHKGTVYWTGDDREAGSPSKPIAPLTDDSKMLYLWLSEYTANTMLSVGQKNNYFHYTLNAEKLPENFRYFLSTSSRLMCIGKLFPQIGATYQNAQVEAKIVSMSDPVIRITTESATLDTMSNINLHAHTEDHKNPFLLGFTMNLSLSLQPSIVNEKVTAKITKHSIKIKVGKSSLGKVEESVLNPILGIVISTFVIPRVQKFLDKGIDLPVTGEVTFENINLLLLDGSIVIATDVQRK